MLEGENDPFLRTAAESDLALIALIRRADMLVSVQAQIAVQHVPQKFVAKVINGTRSDRQLFGRRTRNRTMSKVRNCWAGSGHKLNSLPKTTAIGVPIFKEAPNIVKSMSFKSNESLSACKPPRTGIYYYVFDS